MSVNLVAEIASKATVLPFELQRETLAYIESLIESLENREGAGSEQEPMELLKNESLAQQSDGDWDAELDALAQEISDAWQSEQSAVETLLEMRR